MQYTLRNIPKKVDQALRVRARSEGKSLNETAINILKSGLGIDNTRPKRDLSGIVGTMDDETYRHIQDVRQWSEMIWPDEE